MNAQIEVRRKADDPTGVDFFACGKKLDNITAEKIWTDPSRKVVVRAVVVHIPPKSDPVNTAAEDAGAENSEDGHPTPRAGKKGAKQE